MGGAQHGTARDRREKGGLKNAAVGSGLNPDSSAVSPTLFSGGQRQRLSMPARLDAQIRSADFRMKPTSALDCVGRKQIL